MSVTHAMTPAPSAVVERLKVPRRGRVPFSVEIFLPATIKGSDVCGSRGRVSQRPGPAFVFITYGAACSTQDHTVRTLGEPAHEMTCRPIYCLCLCLHRIK